MFEFWSLFCYDPGFCRHEFLNHYHNSPLEKMHYNALARGHIDSPWQDASDSGENNEINVIQRIFSFHRGPKIYYEV